MIDTYYKTTKQIKLLMTVFFLIFVGCSSPKTDPKVWVHILTSTPIYTHTPTMLVDPAVTPSETPNGPVTPIPSLDFTWDFDNVRCNSNREVIEASIILIITGGLEPYDLTPNAQITVTRENPITVTVKSNTSSGEPSNSKIVSLPSDDILCKGGTDPNSGDPNPPPPVYGCTDPNATNYNPLATADDGSCKYPPQPIYGCTNPNATNYNPSATVDDGSCLYPPSADPQCDDGLDNDGDGYTDWNRDRNLSDPQCQNKNDDDESQ